MTPRATAYSLVGYAFVTACLCGAAYALGMGQGVITGIVGMALVVGIVCVLIGAKVRAVGLRAVPGIKRAIDSIRQMKGQQDTRGDWPDD